MPRTNTPPLGLTRDQLATFLKDHEQIKAFENLFAIVEDIAPDVVQQAIIAAGSAQAGTAQALGALTEIAQGLAIQAAAAETKAQQALDALARLEQDVALLALAPPRREFKRARYGQFYDTTTQIAPAANTATVATFNTTDFSNGVRLRSPSTSEIEVDTEGIYSITVTSQMDNVGGGNHLVNTWLRVNGSNVANSAAQVRLQGGAGENHETKVWLYSFKALDYFEIGWSATDTDAQLIYKAATGVRPAIPSIYLSVSNNIQGVQ